MNDRDFKNLSHQVGNGRINPPSIAGLKGYRPDVTICDRAGKLTFILESEQKTDRKAFLGDLIKAEMYAEQQQVNPALVIVMQELRNTTTKQIASHLLPYARWLASKQSEGKLNLSRIQIMSDVDYLNSVNSCESLDSEGFKKRGYSIFGLQDQLKL